jgi:hypothetical protein
LIPDNRILQFTAIRSLYGDGQTVTPGMDKIPHIHRTSRVGRRRGVVRE